MLKHESDTQLFLLPHSPVTVLKFSENYLLYILPSYLFGQPCLLGQYENDVIGKPGHVQTPSNFTLK